MEQSASREVPEGAMQGTEARRREWWWAEASIWTERMVSALVNGVKGGKWFSLVDKVIRPTSLEAAWRKVARNKGAAGVDGQSIERFAAQAERYMHELHEQLKAGTYRPSPIKTGGDPQRRRADPSVGGSDGQEPAPGESRGPNRADGSEDGDRAGL